MQVFLLTPLIFLLFLFLFSTNNVSANPPIFAFDISPAFVCENRHFSPTGFQTQTRAPIPEENVARENTVPARISIRFFHVQICRGLREYEVLVGARNGLVLFAF